MSTRFHYRSDIDGLRAIAVLAVVGFHAFPDYCRGGFIGVDVFFVISGFLISSILFTHLENNTFSFWDFYQRRIKRIFPALFLILLFCFIVGWFVLLPNEYLQLGKHLMGGSSFSSNFILWSESGYFDTDAETKPLLHLWSLGIEEQFYIIWPLLLWGLWRKKMNVLVITLAITLISFILNVLWVHDNAVATFYSPLTRFWELLSGSLLAWLLLHHDQLMQQFKHGDRLRNFCSLLGFVLIIGCILFFSKKASFPGAKAIIPVLGAVLMIFAGASATLNKMLLSHRILIWFGLISFPLYLWHWPLLSFARIMEDDIPSITIRLIAVALSVILASGTYFYIEKPIRWRNTHSGIKAITLVLLMMGVGLSGFYVQVHHGFSARFNDRAQLLSLNNPPSRYQSTWLPCSKLLPQFQSMQFDGNCLLSKNKMPEILILGDSHAGQYSLALSGQFKDKSVLAIVQTSCFPFSSDFFLKGECRRKYEEVLAFIDANTSIKTIYVMGHWGSLMSGGFAEKGVNWRRAKPVSQEGRTSFLNNGRKFFATALKYHRKLVFFKDIPDLDFNINKCFVMRPLLLPYSESKMNSCFLELAHYKKRTRQYDEVLHQLLLEFPKVSIYDPKAFLCDKQYCKVHDSKQPYYVNGDHLNRYGADLVINDMYDKLGALS